MPKAMVRLSAGRREMGEAVQALCFLAGANSVFYGDKLLTTGNPDVDADRALFFKLGLATGALGRRKRTPRGMKLIADLERGLADREAEGLLRVRRTRRIAAGCADHRRRPAARQLRKQRLPRPREPPGRRRRRSRRRGPLGRGRRRVASDLRPLHGACGTRNGACGVDTPLCRCTGADVRQRLSRQPGDPHHPCRARRRDFRGPAESRVPQRRRAAVARGFRPLSASRPRTSARAPRRIDRAAQAHCHRRRVQHGWRPRAAAGPARSRARVRRVAGGRRRARLRRAGRGRRRRTRDGRSIRTRVRTDRLHGHAGQGRGRGGRIRRRASGGDRDTRSDGADLRVHHRRAADARRGACRKPCRDPKRPPPPRPSRGIDRAFPRTDAGPEVGSAAFDDRDPAGGGGRKCRRRRAGRGAVAARLLGARDPAADGSRGHRPVAHHADCAAHAIDDVDALAAALAQLAPATAHAGAQ